MFCVKCGKEIPGTSHFCKYCGTDLINDDILEESHPGDGSIPKNEEKNIIIKENDKKISVSLFALIVFCFILPFVSISCAGQELASLTGVDLLTGGSVGTQEFDPNPIAIIAIISAIFGIGFSLLKGKASTIIASITGLIGTGSLIAIKFIVDDALNQATQDMGKGIIITKWQIGYYLALILFLGATFYHAYLTLNTPREISKKNHSNLLTAIMVLLLVVAIGTVSITYIPQFSEGYGILLKDGNKNIQTAGSSTTSNDETKINSGISKQTSQVKSVPKDTSEEYIKKMNELSDAEQIIQDYNSKRKDFIALLGQVENGELSIGDYLRSVNVAKMERETLLERTQALINRSYNSNLHSNMQLTLKYAIDYCVFSSMAGEALEHGHQAEKEQSIAKANACASTLKDTLAAYSTTIEQEKSKLKQLNN